MNLALNAMEAVPEGGSCRVSCRLGEENLREVVVNVDDNGPGIPVQLRDRIFEPFFTTKPGGSGLGLSIVHAIVTQHGGSIAVKNSPSGGARFTLRLPVAG
jgi:signal transduction histidine kinase